jgi:hypothetical protein
MIIYNVTVKVQSSIHHEWLNWLQREHVPEIVATGCFTHASLLRLLETDDSEGPTYAIQFHAESKAAFNLYMENFSRVMTQKAQGKWGEQVLAFASVLQVVN